MEFIKSNITVNPVTNCWIWNKSATSAGYGQFTKNKKYWTTHRYVYTQVFGEIPKNLLVRHKCHNSKCCNPSHLELGTNKDNWYDSEEKHRKASAKLAKGYYVDGIYFRTSREVVENTGITFSSICKFTDKNTRIFDIESYRLGCKISRKKPKI